jgi:hypothetical protein
MEFTIQEFVTRLGLGVIKQKEAYDDEKKKLILSQKRELVGSMKEVFKKDLNAGFLRKQTWTRTQTQTLGPWSIHDFETQ